MKVPQVIPETEEEKYLYETGSERVKIRNLKREQNNALVAKLLIDKPWD